MRTDQPESNQRLCSGDSPKALYQEASRFMNEAVGLDPNELEGKVDEAERKIAKLRDCLIEQHRQDSSAPGQSRWRKPLDQVNVALSLVAAVEYPATGIHRSYLEDTHKVLKAMERLLPD